MIKKQ